MKRKIIFLTMTIMVCCLPITFLEKAEASEQTMTTKVNNIIAKNWKNNEYSITVRDTEKGDVLYNKNGEKMIRPASSHKILVSAAALDLLGPDYRFETKVYVDGPIEDGVLQGNIYLQGGGDPTLLPIHLESLANGLKKMGISKVTGSLIADDTWFDTDRLPKGIVPQEEALPYASRISALTISPNEQYDIATVQVKVTGSKVGNTANVQLVPFASTIPVVNKTKIVKKGEKSTVKITREYGTDRIIITGNLPAGSQKNTYVTVFDPTLYTLDVFREKLVAKGIQTMPLEIGKVPENAQRVGISYSKPLQDINFKFLKLSLNGMGDMFTKQIGRELLGEGSWSAGIQAIRTYGNDIGLNMDQWYFEDGSGLSHQNRVSSMQESLLLYKVRSKPWYYSYLDALPHAGRKGALVGATLENRMKGYSVSAKTGYISGTYSLSGYVKGKSGKWYIFSILTQANKTSAIPSIDEIVKQIANEM
ncbi:D-alanyl-D-alanine carboxypeptidase/D-alanyl-D-alanine-endopeptidase [Lysinibacillus sp. fls2-241-R2A-57]|uniref:D-alanyl-D-alanine carboxypeptidase/D-alanyl-D-alanine endopeptidase n=1 Tax=Lysinibacillus sp. fls2-241-R2A-57 TaxID=3040292 RepID=UPI00255230D1|nr:D-alanyl-D-alanine carboxypeptidase/D-alanyl-D-alanine-endopeptidase [Lysinibacillus sp. fls2-241-R2A-57]